MSDQPKKNINAMRRSGRGAFAPPIAQLIGMRAVAFDEGVAVLELDADGRHANSMGTLHGGVLCDLADLAMGVACYSTLDDEARRANFLGREVLRMNVRSNPNA